MSTKKDTWTVMPPLGNESDYVSILLSFLMQEYERIFGQNVMGAEPCVVYNDPSATCPMLITNRNPIMIRLAQSSTVYWAQTIYQLSHEMCHYAIRQGKANKEYTIKWLEEIICEAMSLYALQYCAEKWDRCALYSMNSTFSISLNNYLQDELQKNHKTHLANINSMEQLMLFNKEAEETREKHREERNRLYYTISAAPEDCICFLEMYRYINGDLITIDFSEWQKHNHTHIIQVLEQMQPVIDAIYSVDN